MSKNESICSNVLSAYDSDIRLLDNVRTCIVLRIKCDREYATSLQLIAGNAGKKDLMRNTNQSSLAAAWSVIGQETETLSKLIRKRTDIMTKEVLEPLDKFTEEVKVTRKVFSDEKGKLDAEVHKAKTLLSKTKADYEKCLSVYVLNKSKFEHCTTHVTSPREQNSIYASLSIISRRTKNHVELKRKFLKAARKLHNVHNNYVMLCEEVQLLILDHKTRLEPYITTIQMGHLRELAERVKSILEAFVEVTDWTGEKFQALQWRIKNQLLTIQDKDDYKQLEDRIKLGLIDSQDVDATIKRRPVSSVNKMELSSMKFDDMLLKNHQGSLRAGSLAVDSFTFDSLKNIQYELQAKLVQCQQEMKSKEKLIQQKENEISALSTLCSGSGYDTMAIETSRTMVRNPNSRAITSVAIREKAIEVLRKELIELEAKHNRMHAIWEKLDGALATVKDSTVPLGVPMADEADIRLDHVTKVTSRVTRSETPGSQLSATYSVVANMGKYVVTQLGKVKGMAARSSPKPQVVPPSRLLKDEPWFHGALPREDVAKLLNENGDYFVRETVKSGETRLVVSLIDQMQIKHFLITETTDGLFKLEGPTFYTVGDLMDYHVTHQIPLTIKSGCVIKRPINRQKWELSPQDIDLKEKIGRGNFGDVFKGLLKLSPGRVPLEVAVKTCKINLPDEQKQKFIREGRILQQYSHENIVKFIGISITSNGPIMLIMELVGGGSLLSYLRENRSSPDKVSVRELLRMSLDAASGMRYLESKNVIHRDLAARNCLISTGGHVKISDFGMSREAVDEEYTVSNGLKQIPVKWTAPEALNYGRYTSLCDVWSFGILLWEIFTLGSVPYAGMTNIKTREMIDNGYRLPSPPSCPVLVYQLMKTSWSYEPDERIRFEKIYPLLEDIYKSFVKFNPK